ncbi:hypothetical protein [Kribbella sp. VKM Ac-2571]|nr:hypothetical protein [Kribbella sp. VKM Ac-2571]
MKLYLSPAVSGHRRRFLTSRAHRWYAVPRAAREIRGDGQLTEV